ncbi:diacylglycerol kinase family protein [Kitasatospora sp. NPDC048540]|uniref:diacylglycerol/lipid kinase family protein n=1 Tax=unclassified Kitasatospora TaxID=2633591 RepID=UPI00053B5BC2|nr:diacylglycerol kinase family protein [Kitasatospora sp. MBT63]
MSGPKEAAGRARVLARTALGCGVLAVLVLLALVVLRGPGLVLAAAAGLTAAAAGAWWTLAHRGLVRVLGAVLVLLALGALMAFFVGTGLWAPAVAALALWVAALTCADRALRLTRPVADLLAHVSPAPRRAVLIMNPRSGGGKVERFGLVARAESLGARVVLLDTSVTQDVAAIARQAVADGADLLGVAGGDGTQALVAEVAAEHDLPFLVVSAGTRNHFAMDLGLDRTDPSRCLDALLQGVELRVDLGTVAGRAFVNTVSFGAYAEIVQSPAYRDAKAGTALEALPELLAGQAGARLTADADGVRLTHPQALLVSNNPYDTRDRLGGGRRPRLDTGRLGVLGLRVEGAAQAAAVALGAQSAGITELTATEVVVTADAPEIPVAVDGESLMLPVPVRCTLRPGALRVRVPRDRPGNPRTGLLRNWHRLRALALHH